jgi:hypothetical protein
MSASRKRLLCVVAAFTVVALAIVWLARSGSAGRLLDGTQVVLQRVSYGTNYWVPKAPLEDLLGHLPASWYGKIHWTPSSGMGGASTRPIFYFWLNFSSPTAATQSISYAIADEHGFEVPLVFEGPYGSYTPGGFSKRHIGRVQATGTFPHRSRTFALSLYQQAANGQPVRVARFPIRNLGFENSPLWKPQELPIVYATNGFSLALVKATVGVRPPGPLAAPYSAQAGQWSEFRFRVTSQASPAAGWIINEMLIGDATGNQLRVSGEDLGAFNHEFSRLEKDEIICCHRWEFWADEPAWKLRVHFEGPADNSKSYSIESYWIEYLVCPQFQ